MTFVETESEVAISADEPDHVDFDSAPFRSGHGQFTPWGLTLRDVMVLTAGAVFCAGFGPFEFTSWTPRMAALLAGLPLGIVILGRLAWRRDKAALLALAFLAWALIGVLASAAPMRSFIGQVNGNTQSAVMFMGVFGFWALARTMSERGRALVGPVLVGALAVTALVGVVQIVFDIHTGVLGAVGDRAGGLEGNAVYFGTSLCGAIAWCASSALTAVQRRTRRLSIAGVVFFGLAIGLSGSRVSVVSTLVVCAVVCVRARTTHSLVVPGAAALGLSLSLFIQRQVGGGVNTAERFAANSGGERAELWRAGLSAFRERPVVGWGLGRVRPAIQHFFSPAFVRLFQTDDFSETWTDVHNVVIQMLVSVGVIGVVLLLAFVVLAGRRADFTLSLAAVAISINWLLQPTGLYSLAVVALLLGAAGTRVSISDDRAHRWLQLLTASCVALGVFAALFLLVADVRLRAAVQGDDNAGIRSASAWFVDDTFVIDRFVLDSYSRDVAGEGVLREATARHLTELEPDVPTWWAELAMTQWENGDYAGMRTSIDTAMALQPNHTRSWVLLAIYARKVGDDRLVLSARKRACDLGAPVCGPIADVTGVGNSVDAPTIP